MLLFLFVVIFATLSVCSSNSNSEDLDIPQRVDGLAPLYDFDHQSHIPDEFIVMFHENHTHEQHFDFIGRDLSELDEYEALGYGYTMNLSDSTLRENVRRDPGVMLLEANRYAHLVDSGWLSPSQLKYNDSDAEGTKSKRSYTSNFVDEACDSLQMLSASGKLSTPVTYYGPYEWVHGAGRGVNVYVFDTGIRITHKAFTGRARNFQNLSPTAKSPYSDGGHMDDLYGHGTHMAGIIGAKTYGVAQRANLINVKITNDSGQGANLAKIGNAILAVIKEHNINKAKKPDYEAFLFTGSIINMSFAWHGDSRPLLYMLKKAKQAGIQLYAAAGNDNFDASNTYPCANDGVKCIAAVGNSYRKAGFSNYGSAIDFLAPGVDIQSLGIGYDAFDNDALAYYSGTSQATAHASGVAAIFTYWAGIINEQGAAMPDYMWYNSLPNICDGFSRDTPNRFINSGINSPKAGITEPFVWAGPWPWKNNKVNLYLISLPPALDMQLTTFAVQLAHSSHVRISGLTIEPSVAQTFAHSESTPAAPTVTFSFDPLTSTPVPATTSEVISASVIA